MTWTFSPLPALLITELQGFGEELMFRSYIMQTVSSWFRLPVLGLIVQMLVFTAIHPYNIVGRVEIAVSAVIYALVVILAKGLESATSLHIINNMSEIYMVGIGFGSITAEANIPDTAINVLLKVLFLIFILYADRKLHWFDEVICDDVEKYNIKEEK